MAFRSTLIRCALIPSSLVLIALAIWATVERQTFHPVYTPLKCTNPAATIHLDIFQLLTEGINKSLPVHMDCRNENAFHVSMKSSAEGSLGRALWPNMTHPGSPPIPVGEVTYRGMELGPDSLAAQDMSLHITLSPELIFTALGYMALHDNAAPMYLMLDARVNARATFMFVSKTLRDVLPVKYCGFHLRLVGAGANVSIIISAPMLCRDTLQDMQAAVAAQNVTAGTAGYVDHLDPTQETLDHLAGQINVASAVAMAAGYGIGIVLLSVALALLWPLAAASKRATRELEKGQKEDGHSRTAV